jgi:hypothetical protein
VFCGVVALCVVSLPSGSAVACDLGKRLASMGISARTPAVTNAASTPSATANWSGREDAAITGFWLVNMFDANGTLVDQIYENAFRDHNQLEIDQTPPELGNSCNGTWVQSGEREYKVYHPTWQFDPTTFVANAYGVLRETWKLSEDGQSFSGTNVITLYNLDGSFAGGPFEFQLQGKRLKVDF